MKQITYCTPTKIILTDGNVRNAESLLKTKVTQIGLGENDLTLISGNARVVLDFGRETCGGVRILTHYINGGKPVGIRFGESVTEAITTLGVKNATNDHSPRDFLVEIPQLSDLTFGQTGFRFLRIDFSEEAAFAIKSIVAACDEIEREQTGEFLSDDDRMNEIWQTAAYTLKLCLKNGYVWDGIKRDRLVWIGDIYPETKTSFCLYPDVPEIKNSLIFCRDQTDEGVWMNGIPNYSAWWIYNLYEYYMRTSDEAFVKENLGFVKRIVSDFYPFVDEDGTTRLPFDFIDWGSHYVEKEDFVDFDENSLEGSRELDKKYDELAGTNYLLRIVMNKAEYLLDKFGEDSSLAREIVKRLERKTHKVRKYKQIAALAILAGEETQENIDVILNGGAQGLTTFLNYFIFKAMAKMNKRDEAETMIREYYGKMLDLGATTFWEDFDVEWFENANRIDEMLQSGKVDPHGDKGRFCYTGYRHSFCHGWASGVLAYMTEYIAGIRPIEDKPDEYELDPHLGSLNSVKAVYPTLKGNIEVEIKKSPDGSYIKNLTAPKDIKVTIK